MFSSTLVLLTYNQLPFIRECISSIPHQTSAPSQIVISDDFSTDGTWKAINDETESLKQCTADLVLVRTDRNLGVTKNLQFALSYARSDIIIFACGDDVLMPKRIECVLTYFNINKNVKGLFTNLEIVGKDSSSLGCYFSSPPSFAQSPLDIFLMKGVWCIGASMAIRRDVLEIFTPLPMHHIASDGQLAFRCLLTGDFHYLDTPSVKYRVHGANLSQGLTISEKVKWLKRMPSYFETLGKDALFFGNIPLFLFFGLKSLFYLILLSVPFSDAIISAAFRIK